MEKYRLTFFRGNVQTNQIEFDCADPEQAVSSIGQYLDSSGACWHTYKTEFCCQILYADGPGNRKAVFQHGDSCKVGPETYI